MGRGVYTPEYGGTGEREGMRGRQTAVKAYQAWKEEIVYTSAKWVLFIGLFIALRLEY